jgi:hypothetical protein
MRGLRKERTNNREMNPRFIVASAGKWNLARSIIIIEHETQTVLHARDNSVQPGWALKS